MAQINTSAGTSAPVSRQTLRLTVKASAKGFELISVERLQMITPPQPGEHPEAGKHGGHWFELRDGRNKVLAYRIIDTSMLSSVEVHSPDGQIRREFGDIQDRVFEVLLPDVNGAESVVVMGDPLVRPKSGERAAVRSTELARFDLAQKLKEKKP